MMQVDDMDDMEDIFEEMRDIVSKHPITIITPTQIPNLNPSCRTGREYVQPGEIEMIFVDYLSMIR